MSQTIERNHLRELESEAIYVMREVARITSYNVCYTKLLRL